MMAGQPDRVTVYSKVLALIHATPGLTERELAHVLFGTPPAPARIDFSCKLLISRGLVDRTGQGTSRSPYRYVAAVDTHNLSAPASKDH